MRLTHSSSTLRWCGVVCVVLSGSGLLGQGVERLLAQETPLPAPALPKTAEADDADAAVGPLRLGDVLPDDVPDPVSSSVIQELLPESWADWGTEVAELFEELYEDDPSPEDTARILRRLRVKKGTLDKAIGDYKYRKITSELSTLRRRIVRRLELFEAVSRLVNSGYQVDPEAATNALYGDAFRDTVAAMNLVGRVSTGVKWRKFLWLDQLSGVLGRRDRSDEAVELMDAVSRKISRTGDYSEGQADFLSREPLRQLAASLDALTERLDDAPSRRDATAEGIADLVQAVEDYERFGSAKAAGELQDALPSLRSGGGSELAGLISRLYLQDNFRAAVGESLIVSLMNDSRVEQGLINECVSGARVVGTQLTSADLMVDLVPNSSSAAFRLMLTGNVQTDTRGIVRQATVFLKGFHRFSADKSVTFDGNYFGASPAAVGVAADNRVYGARARTRLPILRRIVRNIALDRAREQTASSNNLTANKISEEVGGKFNEEVNELLGKAQSRLQQQFYARLRAAGMYPERQQVSTTDVTLNMSARVRTGRELAASAPPPLPVPGSGAAFQLHESYLNNAINRMNIAGRTMGNDEVRAEFRRFAETLTGRPMQSGGSGRVVTLEEPGENADEESDEEVKDAKFIFDADDPIRVQVDDSRLTLILRTGLKLEEGKDDIPQQIIEIPMDVTQSGSFVTLRPGTISVTPVERPRSRFRQIAQANVMRNKIRDTLPARRADLRFNFQLEKKRLALALQTLDLQNGWITGTLQ